MDPFLEKNGFSQGTLSFSIPDFGILFRCRTDGDPLDLEFASFFALLEFIKTKLNNTRVTNVQVLSSNPHFVFSFTGNSPQFAPGTARRKLLDQYASSIRVSVGYVKPIDNRALFSSADQPSLPIDRHVDLKIDPAELKKTEFGPFQKGIKL